MRADVGDGAARPLPSTRVARLPRELLPDGILHVTARAVYEFRLFVDDAEFVLMEEEPIVGADAFVEFVSGSAEGTLTVHHGHLPELTLVGPDEAEGSWQLVDYVEWPPDPETGGRRGRVGYGRYDVGYRKVAGEWKVARWALSYARNDRLPRAIASDDSAAIVRAFGWELPHGHNTIRRPRHRQRDRRCHCPHR